MTRDPATATAPATDRRGAESGVSPVARRPGARTGRAITLLRYLVNSRRLTRDETRALLHAQAKALGMNGFRIEHRQFDRWLSGQIKSRPHPQSCRVLEAAFGYPVEALLAPLGAAPADHRHDGPPLEQPVTPAPPGLRTTPPDDPLAAVAALTAAVCALSRQTEHLAASIATHSHQCSPRQPATTRAVNERLARPAVAQHHCTPEREPPSNALIDTTVAHTARVWNYWLGGNDNYAIDRKVGDQILEVMPHIKDSARACRAFLVRAVRHLAGEVGIRQFLDLGCGLPIPTDIHEVAQAVAPESKVVYVDNDPLVMAHARALLVGDPLGVTDHIEADVRDFDTVMTQTAHTFDFNEPIAVIISGILGHIVDDNEARSLVDRIVSAVPAESYLVISDHTNVIGSQQSEVEEIWNQHAKPPYRLRTPDQIVCFFNGLELVEPGVVSATRWRPDLTAMQLPAELGNLVGIGRTTASSLPTPRLAPERGAACPRRRRG